jgi:predicted enzyme related to lactoylglutathione lyase
MPTIVHFDIPADDVERAKKFYSDLFGWKIEKWSESGTGDMEYWMVTTTNGKGNKGIDGGIMKRQNPQHQVTNSIDVKSVDEYSSKVQQLGGKVVYPKMAIPKMGYFAGCLDTEDNSFGIFEYNTSAK